MEIQIKNLLNQEIEDNVNIIKRYIYELIKPYTNQDIANETNRIYNNMIKFTKDKSAIIIGAWNYNILIGFVWGYILPNNDKKAHINYFYINDEYRCKGIGRLLIENLEKNLTSININEVELFVDTINEKALNFYIRNRFQIEEKNNNKIKLIKNI